MANIAFILNKFPDGGIERVTMNLVGPLARNKGHKIFLFVNDLNEERLVGADLPVTYLHIPYPSWRKENRDAVYEAIIKERFYCKQRKRRSKPRMIMKGCLAGFVMIDLSWDEDDIAHIFCAETTTAAAEPTAMADHIQIIKI